MFYHCLTLSSTNSRGFYCGGPSAGWQNIVVMFCAQKYQFEKHPFIWDLFLNQARYLWSHGCWVVIPRGGWLLGESITKLPTWLGNWQGLFGLVFQTQVLDHHKLIFACALKFIVVLKASSTTSSIYARGKCMIVPLSARAGRLHMPAVVISLIYAGADSATIQNPNQWMHQTSS